MEEAHKSKFSLHPGKTKMYQILKQNFWWPSKKEIAEFCFKMFAMSTSKSRAPKTGGSTSTSPNPRVEVGTSNDGFYCWFTLNAPRYEFHMGYC